MKISKTASGKQLISLNKQEWRNIGKKAGWMKESQESNAMDSLYNRFQGMQPSKKPIYVSLYETSRAYGGPEEGGWWYTINTLESSKKFYDQDEAEAFLNQLNAWIENNDLNAEPLSTSRGFDKYPDPSGGDPMYDHSDNDIPLGFSGDSSNYFAIIEDTQGSLETTERPHYE